MRPLRVLGSFLIGVLSFLAGLAGKVKRKDTLALKLEKQQEREEKQGQADTWKTREQWEALRSQIGSTLTRYVGCVCVYTFVTANQQIVIT